MIYTHGFRKVFSPKADEFLSPEADGHCGSLKSSQPTEYNLSSFLAMSWLWCTSVEPKSSAVAFEYATIANETGLGEAAFADEVPRDPSLTQVADEVLDLKIRSLDGEILCNISATSSWKAAELCEAIQESAGIDVMEQVLFADATPLKTTDSLSILSGSTEITMLRRSKEQTEWLKKVHDSEDGSVLKHAPQHIQQDLAINLAAVSKKTQEPWKHVSKDLLENEDFLRAALELDSEMIKHAYSISTDQHFLRGCAKLRGNGGQYGQLLTHPRAHRRIVQILNSLGQL